MTRRLRIVSAEAVALVALFMSACGGRGASAARGGGASSEGGGEPKTIGVSVADQKSLFYIAEADVSRKRG